MEIDTEDEGLLQHYSVQSRTGRNTRYAYINIKNHHHLIHRLVMGETDPKVNIDHIDGNGLNNRKANLRRATVPQNHWNSKTYSNNRSGYKGVGWSKDHGAWRARIKCHNRSMLLGYFSTKEEAARAYNEKAKELFGVYARLNNVFAEQTSLDVRPNVPDSVPVTSTFAGQTLFRGTRNTPPRPKLPVKLRQRVELEVEQPPRPKLRVVFKIQANISNE